MYLTKEVRTINTLIEEINNLKEHLMHLSAQIQSVTQRLNCLSDKVSDQGVLVQKIID